MLKKIGYGVAGLLIALIATVGLVFWMLTPPGLSVPKQKDRMITGVTVWNPGQAAIEDQTLVIRDGVILDIRDTQAGDEAPICAGCFVMPGLIDAHVHTPPKLAIGNQRLFSLLYLKYGVTTVRDLGQFDDSIPALARKLNNGKMVGPRMYRCGPILGGDPPKTPGGVAVLSEEDGAAIVRKLADEAVDCIKVYDGLPEAAFTGISAQAAALDLPLIGHTPHSVKMSDIRDFESQHYTGIPYLHRNAPKGWAYKSEDLMNLTPDEVAEVIGVMTANSIAFLPTNANHVARLTVSDPARFPASDGLRHMPDFWQIAWPSIVSHPETEAEIEIELRGIPAALDFARQAQLGGVDVLVGTDVVMPYVVPGESLHLQLEIFADVFGSSETALHAATAINGKHIDKGKIGRLQTGAFADMLIFENDPRNDLNSVQNWYMLMAGGRLYTRDYIDRSVARYDRHFRGAFYSSVLNFAYSQIAGDYEGTGVARHDVED